VGKREFFLALKGWHRRLAALVLIPSSVIFMTGLLLQLKNYIPLLQPPQPQIEFQRILGAPMLLRPELLQRAKSISKAQVHDWTDIAQIDIRPNKNLIRLRTFNHYEIQFSLDSMQLLNHGPRYAGLILSIHSGDFFGTLIKQTLFSVSALLLLFLWITGMALWLNTFNWKRV
jgi:hypothetical protein